MPLEARILRVADIFQAMAQDRPYRKGLNAGEVTDFLDKLVAEHRLDGEIVATAKRCIDEAMHAARRQN